MDARKIRIQHILATGKIQRQSDIYFVPRKSGRPRHSRDWTAKRVVASWPDFNMGQPPCKHILTVWPSSSSSTRTS